MNVVDRVVAAFSPARGVERARARKALAYYEAAEPTRLRKARRDGGSGTMEAVRAGRSLRTLARHLDQNHDLARGALNVLVANVVGPHGITPEPQPRRTDGSIHAEFAQALMVLWRDWVLVPEVSQSLTWSMAQRLIARTWLRDGEVLMQHLEGAVPYLDHGTRVPYSVELIEPDLLPIDFSDAGRGIVAGVERNAWGRPRAYHLYRQHPGDLFAASVPTTAMRRVPADMVTHLKLTDRINQVRGVSVFASVLTRLDDLKDYEESERVAAKVAASMAAYIKKGSPDMYDMPTSTDGPPDPRSMMMRAGMIFDDLRPGEEIGVIDSKRPNPNAGAWRDDQIRAVSAGIGVGNSSVSRRYEGTYNARRQEMVESWVHYAMLQQQFIDLCLRPVWRRFVTGAIAARLLAVPADVVPDSIDDAHYQGPVMPALDPLKEAEANQLNEQCGYRSGPAIIRAGGGNPDEVLAQEAAWRKKAAEQGVALATDPATAALAAPGARPAPDPDEIDSEDDSAGSPPAARWGGMR